MKALEYDIELILWLAFLGGAFLLLLGSIYKFRHELYASFSEVMLKTLLGMIIFVLPVSILFMFLPAPLFVTGPLSASTTEELLRRHILKQDSDLSNLGTSVCVGLSFGICELSNTLILVLQNWNAWEGDNTPLLLGVGAFTELSVGFVTHCFFTWVQLSTPMRTSLFSVLPAMGIHFLYDFFLML